MMKTRFSLELKLDEAENLRIFQVFQYLIELEGGNAMVPRELADYLAPCKTEHTLPETRFAQRIGTEPIGIDFMMVGKSDVRFFDTDGAPNLRMLCQIIANVVPRVLPLEFSFALIDDDNHRYSGGLVVMSTTSAEIQTIDSLLNRRGGRALH